jgi:hypothetical protein
MTQLILKRVGYVAESRRASRRAKYRAMQILGRVFHGIWLPF